jgi:hypothetical protein
MVLEPFGPWPLFQVLNPIHSRYDFSDGGSARRKATTYIHTEQTHTDIHASSGIRAYDPTVREGEDVTCIRPCGECDRPLAYNYIIYYNYI